MVDQTVQNDDQPNHFKMPATDLGKLSERSAPAANSLKPRSTMTRKAKELLQGNKWRSFDGAGGSTDHTLPEGVTMAEALVNVAAEHAMDGDHFFFKELWDRTEGKVPTRLANADGKNLPSQVVMVEICLPQPMIQAVVTSTVHEIVQSEQRSGEADQQGEEVAEPAD